MNMLHSQKPRAVDRGVLYTELSLAEQRVMRRFSTLVTDAPWEVVADLMPEALANALAERGYASYFDSDSESGWVLTAEYRARRG